MDEGRIVEQGTHGSLLVRRGPYYEMARSQLQLGEMQPTGAAASRRMAGKDADVVRAEPNVDAGRRNKLGRGAWPRSMALGPHPCPGEIAATFLARRLRFSRLVGRGVHLRKAC